MAAERAALFYESISVLLTLRTVPMPWLATVVGGMGVGSDSPP